MASTPVLLFDLDGTLVDTERVAVKVTANYFHRHQIQVSQNDLDYLIGRPWLSAGEYLLGKYPLKKSAEQFETEILVDYRAALQADIPIIPGSVEAIKDLSTSYRMGIVSGSRRKDIETILGALKITSHFEHLLGFEDYAEGKPSPEPYLEALRKFGVRASEALIFEDSPAGIQAAVAAKIKVITVGEGKRIPHFEGVNCAWVSRAFGVLIE